KSGYDVVSFRRGCFRLAYRHEKTYRSKTEPGNLRLHQLLLVPLWKQKSGHEDRPVIWDYHVILLKVGVKSDAVIYDLDSVLPFPCNLRLYAAQALRSDRTLRPKFHRKLRVVPAHCFLLNFASDRSHMKNADGTWKMPPPSYRPIQTAESKMNLDDFISMNPAVGWGTVYTLGQFLLKYVVEDSSASASSSTAVS
uniref:Protein N-terminal glutamine amidohydrolase n=1 Tax=Oryzias melastigma TaxID=30732 RepID=A0A3B3DAG9_ORYME